MSFVTNIQSAFVRVATEFKAIRVQVFGSATGDASGLSTASKNIVGAINELYAGGGAGGVAALDDLTDVTITMPVGGQILRYENGVWANVDADFGPPTLALGDLTDVADWISAPPGEGAGDYELLVYNPSGDNQWESIAFLQRDGQGNVKDYQAAAQNLAQIAEAPNVNQYWLDTILALRDQNDLRTAIGAAAVAYSGSASDLTTGTLPTSVLPALAIVDVFEVASQTAMLALTAQRGDVAVRSDIAKSLILSADDASVLANWVELPAVGSIVSINGQQGVVNLSWADVGAQQSDSTLAALAGLVVGANKLIYATGPDAFSTTDLTAFARTLLDDADAATARNTLSVYSKAEIGDSETDFVAIFQSALA